MSGDGSGDCGMYMHRVTFLELIPESTSARDDQTPSSLDVDKGLDADGFLQLFNQTKKWYGYLSDYMVSVAGYP